MRSPQYGNSPGRGIEKERAQHACGLTHFRLRSPGPLDTHPCPLPLASGQWKNKEDTVRLTPTAYQASDPQEPSGLLVPQTQQGWGTVTRQTASVSDFPGGVFILFTVYFSDFPKHAAGARRTLAQQTQGMFPAHKEREVGSTTGRRDARPTAAEIPAWDLDIQACV